MRQQRLPGYKENAPLNSSILRMSLDPNRLALTGPQPLPESHKLSLRSFSAKSCTLGNVTHYCEDFASLEDIYSLQYLSTLLPLHLFSFDL